MQLLFSLLLAISFLLSALASWSQSPSSHFDVRHYDAKYLEHLIKEGVDSVRRAHECKPLVNDSILYVAAKDQAHYMTEKQRLTHFRQEIKHKGTPQKRAEFYGANGYSVGENVAQVSAHIGSNDRSEKQENSYGAVASALVEGWVNSPGHFKNIITKDYQITGVAIAVDTSKNNVYACQKFAKVAMRHHFEENRAFFPHSDYSAPPKVSSFDEVPDDILEDYNYPHNLRHDELEKCADCPDKYEESPDISLNYDERKGFVLRVENAEYVQKIIRNRWDGFAVEVVAYDDYACGNSAYYEKPSRRNGQLRTNGIILKPKYRKSVLRGFKKRELQKDLTFFSYIFRKDSVSFFKRFGQYKVDKYASEYFEINLGRLPRNVGRIVNSNLLIIKDHQICDVHYFTQYCGDLFESYRPTAFIPYQSDVDKYGFHPVKDNVDFTVPFQQGEVTFDAERILSPLQRLSEYDFIIDSVHIKAYSSIEGSQKINNRLQLERASNIARIFQGVQSDSIHRKIETDINFKDFRKSLAADRDLQGVLRQNNSALKKEVDRQPQKFSKHLDASRKGRVKVFFHVIPNLKSLDYYIISEWERLGDVIKRKMRLSQGVKGEADQLNELYKYAHWVVENNHVDASIFSSLSFPNIGYSHTELSQLYVLFGSEWPGVFDVFSDWSQDSTMITDQMIAAQKVQLLPAFRYHKLRVLTKRFRSGGRYEEKTLEQLLRTARDLKHYYDWNEKVKRNVDKANFNLNMFVLNHDYVSEQASSQKNAVIALSQVHSFYVEHGLLTDTIAFRLAKMATYYQNPGIGVNIAFPFMYEHNDITGFIHEASYTHPSAPQSDTYYTRLIKDGDRLPDKTWCNMFLKPCGIPFQAFDHEQLRKTYCQRCIGKNNFLNAIYDGEYEGLSVK